MILYLMRLHIFIECDVVNQQNFVNLFVVLTLLCGQYEIVTCCSLLKTKLIQLQK